jgi:hypothetical protein
MLSGQIPSDWGEIKLAGSLEKNISSPTINYFVLHFFVNLEVHWKSCKWTGFFLFGMVGGMVAVFREPYEDMLFEKNTFRLLVLLGNKTSPRYDV